MITPRSIHHLRGSVIPIGPDKENDEDEEEKDFPQWVWVLIILGLLLLCFLVR